MMEPKSRRPLAFVIMPFGKGFDEIFNLFFVETLSASGFEVARADDIKNSQNILKDIVKGISECNLIIADLTDSNPNVYYELGLAHALRKPVVLFTQDINELPFDLRSYRVIPYQTYFADISRAKKQLSELLSGFLEGTAEFGSPITDFLPHFEPAFSKESPKNIEGEPGFLDHLVAMEEGFEKMVEIITDIGTQTSELTEMTNKITEQLQNAATQPQRGYARSVRSLFMSLAQKLTNYATSLSADNIKYTAALTDSRSALETIVRMQGNATQEDQSKFKEFLEALSEAEVAARTGLQGFGGMTETLRALPQIERTFNRARDRAVSELQRLLENIEQTISMFSRVREIGEMKLGQIVSEGEQPLAQGRS